MGFPPPFNRAFEMVASDFAADRYRQVAGHPAAGRGGVEIERGILREKYGTPPPDVPSFTSSDNGAGKPGGDGAAGS